MDDSLFWRVHVSPDALARSPGHVGTRFATGMAAMRATQAYLRPLPDALVRLWLARDRGHIVIDAVRQGFRPGMSAFRGRRLEDVAWVRLTLLAEDPIAYLTPVGALIAHLIGWGESPEEKGQPWRDFARGVWSGFEAGYGRSDAARADVDAYLAEGIAWYLADRRGLNVENPRLEKLLRATLFNEAWSQNEICWFD